MFKRLFVANRGEVAARIVRACRELQIEVVCAASTADLKANFQYLQQADQVHRGFCPISVLFATRANRASRQTNKLQRFASRLGVLSRK